MAYKARYTKQDDVPEAVRAFYVEKDGAWIPDLEQVGDYGLGDHGKTTRALSTEREAVRTAKADAATARAERDTMQTQIDGMGDWGSDDKRKAAIEAAVAPHKRRFDEQEAALKTRQAVLEGVVNSELRTNRASAAISNHAKDPRAVKALLPIVNSRTRVVEANGSFDVQVLEEDGKTPMLSRSDSNSNMGIDEFVKDVLGKDETYALLFRGHKASGTGDTGAGGDGGKGSEGGQPRTINDSDVDAKASSLEDISEGKAVVKGAG